MLGRGDFKTQRRRERRVDAQTDSLRFYFMYCGSCRIFEIVDDPLQPIHQFYLMEIDQ